MKAVGQREIQRFADGEIIFAEGDTSTEMYVVRAGKIEISKHVAGHSIRLAVLDRGAFFGEMSLLEGLPRSATARAIGNVAVLVLRPGSLLLQIRRDPTFAFELLQQLSGRIRDLNEKLVLKLATAEFGNRLARSAFMMSAAAEYTTARDTGDQPAIR
ncbi:MAG TPA: cyclic nucleotide-binding domain-containing protein [Gemmatimonadaceae bacterium]|nr:cyclic nucleotide-binding domain-containing protein [Gemmatimonadaceae bacterium]